MEDARTFTNKKGAQNKLSVNLKQLNPGIKYNFLVIVQLKYETSMIL